MSRERSTSNDRGARRDERENNGDAPAPAGNAKLFVANLTYNTSERDLEDLFSKHGRIAEVRLAIASDTGRSKGFAFVTMEDARDAADAVRALHGYEIDGRSLKVELAHGEGPRRGRGGDRGGPRSMVCYDWRRGTCQRGDTCRFNHFEDDRRGGRDDYRGERYGRDRSRDRSRDRGGYRDRDDRGDRYRGRDRSRDRSRDRYERRDRSRDRY